MTGIFQIFDRYNALSARKNHASKNHKNHEELAAKDNIIPSYYLLQGDDYMHRGPLDFAERPRKEHAEASGDSMGVVHRTSANNKKHIEVNVLVNSLSNVLNELQPGEVEQKLLRVSGVAFQETKSRHGVLFPDAQKELEDGSPNSMSGKEQSPSQKPHNIQPSEAPPSEIFLSRLSSVSNDSRDSIKRGSKQLPPRDTRSTTLHASKHKEKPRTLLSSVQDSSSKEVFAAAASPTDSNKLVTQVLMQMKEFSQRSSDGKVQAAGRRYHSSGDETEACTQGRRNQLSGDESLEHQHNMKEAGARHGGKCKLNERIHQSSRAKEARLGHQELPPNEGCKHQSSVREGHRFYATSGDKKKIQRQHYSSAADDGDGREEEHRDKNSSLKEFHYKYPSSGDDKHSDCHRYMIPSLNKRELVGDGDYAIENQDPRYRSGNAEENKGHQVQSESGDEKKGGRYMYASVGVKGRRSPFLGKNNGHRYRSSGDEEWEGGQRLHDSSDRDKWKDHKLQLPVKEFAADGEEQRQGHKSPDNHQQEAGHRFLASRNGRVEGNTNSLHAKEVHEYWSESSSDEREVELLGHRHESSADERNLQGRNQLLSAPKGHRHDQSSCGKGEGQRFCLSHDSREDTYRHQSSSEKELDVKQAQSIQLPHSHQEKDCRRYLAAGDGRKLSPSGDYSSQQEGHRHQSSCGGGGSQGSQLESRLDRRNKLGHRTHLPAMEFIADAEQQGTISYQSPRYHQEDTLRYIAPGDEREGQRMNLHGKHRHCTSDDEKLGHRSQSSADVRKGPGANTSPAQEEGHRYRCSGDERKVRQRRQLSHINRREGTQLHFSVGGEHRQSYLSHWDHPEKGGKGHRSNSYAKGVHRSVSSGDTQGRHQFQERCRDRSLVAETWTYKSSGTDDVEENQRMKSSRTLREAQRFTTCPSDEGGGPHSHHLSSHHRQQSASVKDSAQTHQSSADDRREGHRSPSSLDLNEFEHHHSSGDIMRHHKSDLSYDQNEAASKHCFLREPGKSNKHLAQAVGSEAEAHRHHHHHHHHHQCTYSDEEEECQRHDSIDDSRIGHRDNPGAAKDARQRYQSSGDEKGGGAHCSHSSADEMNSQRCKSYGGHREVWYGDSDEGYRHQSSLGLKESDHTLLPSFGNAMQGHNQSRVRLKEGHRHLHQNVLASPKHIEEELSPTSDVNSAPSKKAFAREGKWLQQLAISTSQAEPTSSNSNQSKSDHYMKEVGQIVFKQLKQVSARPQQSSLLKENYAMVKPRLRPRSRSRSMSPSASSQHKRDLYGIESQRPQHMTSKSSHQEGDQPWHKQLMSSKHLQMEAMPLVLKKPQVEHPPTEILLGEGMISDQRLHQLRIKNGLQEHKSLRQVLEAMHLKGLLKQPRGNKQVIMLNAKFLAGLGSSVQEAQSPPLREAKIMPSSAVSNLARSGSMDREYQDIVEFQDMLKEETKAHEEATAQELNQGTEAPIVLMKPCSHQIPSPAAAPTPSPALQQILELESKASPVYNGLAKSPTTVTAPTGNDRENQNESSCTRGRRSLSGRALNKRRSSRSHSPSKWHSQEPAEFHSMLEEQVLSARTSKSECINTADKSRFSSKLEKSGEGFILKVNSQLLLPLHAGHHTSSMSKTPVFPSSGTETSDIVRASQEGSRRIDDSSPKHCNANMKFPMATSEDKEESESTVMLMTSGSESTCILQEPSSSCLRNKFSDEEGLKSVEAAAIQTRPTTTAKNKSHVKLKTRVPSVELGLQTVVSVMDSSDASPLSASPRSTTAEELTKLMKEKQESVSEVTQEAPNGQGLDYQAPHQGGDGSAQGSFVIHINSSGSFNSGCQEAKLIESTGNQVVAVTKLSNAVTAGVSLMKQQVAEEEEEEEMGELAGNANHPSPVSVLDSASFEEEPTHTPKCVKSSTISREGNLHSVNSEQQQSYNKFPSFLDGEKWDIVLKAQNSPDRYQDDEWAYYVKEILAMSGLIIEEACPCIDAVPNKSIKSVMKTEELNSQLKESSSVQEDEEKGNREDNKKMMMFQQSLLHQQLLTDGVKEIVGNGMKPFTDPQPWGVPNLRRKPAGQHLIQEVWDELQDMHCLVTDAYNVLYAILKKDLTRKAFQWQDFSIEIGEVGFELGDLIFEEMLKAAVQELMGL